MFLDALFPLTDVLVALILYQGIFHISFTKSKIRIVAYFIMLFIFSGIASYLPSKDIKVLPAILGILGIPLFLYRGSFRAKQLLHAPLIIIGQTIISNTLFVISSAIFSNLYASGREDAINDLINNALLLFLLMLFFYLVRHFNIDVQDEVILNPPQYIVILCGEGTSLLLCSFFQYYQDNVDIEKLSKQLPFICNLFSLLSLLFLIICLWQQRTSQRSLLLKYEKDEYSRYMSLQADHYHEINEKNDELRRFRHDYRSHLFVLSQYLQDGKSSEARSYLTQITEAFESSEITTFTGIDTLDSLIAFFETDANKNSITWSFTGRLPEISVEDCFSLCTIFSNLLKNALEACKKLSENAFVHTTVSSDRKNIFISIQNSYIENPSVPKKNTSSSANHGWGLKNVNRTVEKNNGYFNISFDGNVCTAEVLFPIKQADSSAAM